MIVISDTSPVNYLVLIDEIDLLPTFFGRVIIPQSVLEELQRPEEPDKVREWLDTEPSWIGVRTASVIDPTISLGAGENEAISLAKEIAAGLVLIDDKKARQTAIEKGLNVAGTINILELASIKNLIEIKDAFDKLQKTNFRISQKIVEEILERERIRKIQDVV